MISSRAYCTGLLAVVFVVAGCGGGAKDAEDRQPEVVEEVDEEVNLNGEKKRGEAPVLGEEDADEAGGSGSALERALQPVQAASGTVIALLLVASLALLVVLEVVWIRMWLRRLHGQTVVAPTSRVATA